MLIFADLCRFFYALLAFRGDYRQEFPDDLYWENSINAFSDVRLQQCFNCSSLCA